MPRRSRKGAIEPLFDVSDGDGGTLNVDDELVGELQRDIDWSEASNSDTFADYVAAIYRLRRGQPKVHAPFVAIAEEGGRIPINQRNVALEADRPRTRISGKNGDFKKLGAYIVSLRSTHGASENTMAKLRRQNEEIAFLEQRVKVYQSKLAVSLITISTLRTELSEREDQLRRERSR